MSQEIDRQSHRQRSFHRETFTERLRIMNSKSNSQGHPRPTSFYHFSIRLSSALGLMPKSPGLKPPYVECLRPRVPWVILNLILETVHHTARFMTPVYFWSMVACLWCSVISVAAIARDPLMANVASRMLPDLQYMQLQCPLVMVVNSVVMTKCGLELI
jgi:hypothetical protein